MSKKNDKKLRQLYNREIRGQFNVLGTMIKQRPYWLPKSMWKKIVYLVINV